MTGRTSLNTWTNVHVSAAWDELSEDEKGAIYGAYQAINETPGVSPGVQMQPPETATTVRVEEAPLEDDPLVRDQLSQRAVEAADALETSGAADRGPARLGRRAPAGRRSCDSVEPGLPLARFGTHRPTSLGSCSAGNSDSRASSRSVQ